MAKNLHPSFDPVPPEEFRRAEQASVPECHEIIQKYDQMFGKAEKDKHRRQIARKRRP